MINDFLQEEGRESSILYESIYNTLVRKYKRGKYEECAELAIAYMQVMLKGRTTTDDEDLLDIVEPYNAMSKKAAERYEKRAETKRTKQKQNLELENIASMINDGMTYQDIADILDMPLSTVGYRAKVIQDNYPELLTISNISNISNV